MGKKKSIINKLAEKGIVGEKPKIWVPFLFALMFFIFSLISEKLGFDWGNRLNYIAWFCIGWGIIHWYVVSELKKK